MAYKKDQGRYARMSAFWALFALIAYGCFSGSGLVYQLRKWLDLKPGDAIVENMPLLGRVDTATLITIGVLAAVGFTIYKLLNRPKTADLLIETEGELRKVTWPSAADTWSGTLAVIAAVGVLLVYLYVVDTVLGQVLFNLMSPGAA